MAENIVINSTPVITWSTGGYGSGTSRQVFIDGKYYGTQQVPSSYSGRDDAYFQSQYPQYKTQEQLKAQNTPVLPQKETIPFTTPQIPSKETMPGIPSLSPILPPKETMPGIPNILPPKETMPIITDPYIEQMTLVSKPSTPINVMTWTGSGYGSGTSRTLYADGHYYGTMQIPESYSGRDEEYIRSQVSKFGYLTPSQVTAQQQATALAAEQARAAEERAYFAAHDAQQAFDLNQLMGSAKTGEIRSISTPGLPIGIEAMKASEIKVAQAKTEFAQSLVGTTPQEAAAISKMLQSPTATFASQESMQKGYDIVQGKGLTITPEQVKANIYVPLAPVAQSIESPIGQTDSFGMPKLSSLPTIAPTTPGKLGFYPSMPGSVAQKSADIKLIESKGGAFAMALTAPTSFGTTYETFHTDADALLYGKNSPQAKEAKNALIATTASRIREIEGRDTLTNLIMIPLESPITYGIPIGAGFKVGTSVLEAGLKVGAEQVAKKAGTSLIPKVVAGGLKVGSKSVEPIAGAIFLAPIVKDIASSKDTGEVIAKVATFGVSLPSFELGTGLGGKITSKIEKVSGAKWGTFDVPQYGLKDIPGSEKISEVVRTKFTEPIIEPIKSSFKDPVRDFILEPLKTRLEPIKSGVSNIVEPIQFGFKEPLKTFINEPIKTGIKSLTPRDQFEFMPSRDVSPTRDIYKQVSPQAKTMMKTSFEAINLLSDIPESAVKGMYQKDVSFGSTKDVGLEGLKIEKVMKNQPKDIMEGSFSTAKFVKGFREARTPTPGRTKLGIGIGDMELTSLNPSGYKGIKTEKFDAFKEISKHSKSFAFGKVGETTKTGFGGLRNEKTVISGGKVLKPIEVEGIRYLSPLQQASQKLEGSIKYMSRKTDILSGEARAREYNVDNEMEGYSSRRGKDVQDVPEIVEALAKAHPDTVKGKKAIELMKQYREAEATKLYAKEPVSTLLEYGYKYAKENPTALAGEALGYNLNKPKSTTPAFLSSTYSTPTKDGNNLIETSSYTPKPTPKNSGGYTYRGNKPTTPAFLSTYPTTNNVDKYPYPTTTKPSIVDGGYYPTPKPVDPIGGGYYPPPPKDGGGYYQPPTNTKPPVYPRPWLDLYYDEGLKSELPVDLPFFKDLEKQVKSKKRKYIPKDKIRKSPIFEGAEKLFANSPIETRKTTHVKQTSTKGKNTKVENFDLGFNTEKIKSHRKHIRNVNKKQFWSV